MGPRGRRARPRGLPAVRTLALPLACALACVLACGGLASPDLSTGEVVGTLQHAQPGAYAYALGAPQTKQPVLDGAFRLQGVPAGDQRVLVWDGAARAELVDVHLAPASRARIDRDALDLPLAGGIAPTAQLPPGIAKKALRFSVEGTEFQDADASALPNGALYPLAPGDYQLRAVLPGFKDHPVKVKVNGGAPDAAAVPLDVDGGAPPKSRGCLASPDTLCDPGLHCAGDGLCHG